MSAHSADIQLDLSNERDTTRFKNAFDVILCAHVLEHVPDYQKALSNLHQMLAPNGFVVLQVPLLEDRYTPVTWDEFHGDNTRVYHRFGFDLVSIMSKAFSRVTPVVGLLDFEITSSEIKPGKYGALLPMRENCIVLGDRAVKLLGLGIPDLCDAIIAYA